MNSIALFQKRKKKCYLYICFQEKVVFVTCEDDDTIGNVRLLEGKHVRLGSILLTFHSSLIWTMLLPCPEKIFCYFLNEHINNHWCLANIL